jgi:PAS domain S-box-containing protein
MGEGKAAHDSPADELSALRLRIRELEQTAAAQEAATQALRESEEQLRMLLAESPDPTFFFTPDGRYRFVNKAFAAGVGKPVEEIIGGTIWDVFPKEEADKRFAALSQVLRTGEEKVIEVRVPRAGGDRFYLTTITPIRDGQGTVRSALCCSKEITARKQAEEELAESRERYRALSEAAFEAIFITEKGVCLEQNATAAKMLGYSDAEAVGMFGTAVIALQDRDLVARNMLSGHEQPYQVTALRKDGTTFPAQVSGRMMHYRGRTVRVTSLRDISERVAAEETLRQSEERLRSLLEHSPISMAIVCMDGTIEYINRRAIDTFGYLPEDIPDMASWWRLAYPDAAYREQVVGQWMGLIERVVAGADREIERREYRVACKDGTVKTMVIFGVLVSGKVFVMFEDITERTRAEEARLGLERQLLHAQKLESLGVLAGGVAHDFNNLLMAMLGNMDLALAQLPAESPAAGNVHQAMAAARMAAGLTNRMLAYSGRGAFVVEEMDLNAVIEENAAMLRAAIAKTATLSVRLWRDLPPVIADAAQVQQVVMNLITNASESLGDRAGAVTLATGVQDCDERYLRRSSLEEKPAPGRFVWLEVADTGCGMSAETALRLFDPFFTTKFAGRGLGMSAVLGIVRGHRGAIVVDSSPGAGTTIRVLFPVGAAAREFPQGGAQTAEPLSPPGLSGRVLIVDDEALVLSVCTAMVRRLGVQVLTAVDGADAVRVFRREGASISAVLLDMTMPRMDGLATLRELRLIRPDVRVILCSGFSEQEIAERFAGERLAGFLQKPYDLKGLKKVLGRVMPGGGGAGRQDNA